MNTPTTHPLVAAYLGELHQLLAGIDPADRAEVMAGVREHLDVALGGSDADENQVRRVLAELGAPREVADEAYAGRVPATAVQRVEPMRRAWVPIVVLLLQAIALLLVVIVVTGAAAVVVSESYIDGVKVPGSSELSGSPLVGSLAGMLMSLPMWALAALLVGLSPLWTAREKVMYAPLVPVAAVLLGAVPQLGYVLIGVTGVYAGTWIALALVVVGGGWLITRLTRRATTRVP